MMTKDESDLAHARGIIADCCHYSDAAVIAACDTILLLRTLRDTLEKTAA